VNKPTRPCKTCGKPTRRNYDKGLAESTECDSCYDLRTGVEIVCPVCGETKRVRASVFRRAVSAGDEPCCSKPCASRRSIQRQREAGLLTNQTPEEKQAYDHAYYLANREEALVRARAWQAEHPELTASYKAKTRDRLRSDPEYYAMEKRMAVLNRHGLTIEDFNALLVAQSGLCAICSTQLIKPHIDHCHIEGHVRGLLCHLCNIGLGMFRDNPALLEAAIVYLTEDRGDGSSVPASPHGK
jgi:hypothetical protein